MISDILKDNFATGYVIKLTFNNGTCKTYTVRHAHPEL